MVFRACCCFHQSHLFQRLGLSGHDALSQALLVDMVDMVGLQMGLQYWVTAPQKLCAEE
jgi:hypothetical protein